VISEEGLRRLLENQVRVEQALPPPQQPNTARRRGVPNKWERRFRDEVLEPRRRVGEIRWYDFEAVKFRLADGAWYTPDFIAHEAVRIVAYEVKGHWREAARVRIKVAAEKYPTLKFVAVTRDHRGVWQYECFHGRGSDDPLALLGLRRR